MVKQSWLAARRRSVQVFRRVDRPGRQGRVRRPHQGEPPSASSAMSFVTTGVGRTRSTISMTSAVSDKRNPTVNATRGAVFGQPELLDR